MYIPFGDKDRFVDRLKFAMTKKDVVQMVSFAYDFGIEPHEMISLSLHKDNSISFHAAWILENMLIGNQEALDYYLPSIINKLLLTNNTSVQRHLAKLTAIGINRIVKRKSSVLFQKEFWKINLEPLEEVCFKWFVDDDTKPAVKAHCMEILYLLSTREKWIAEELPHIIENQMEYGSPGIITRGRAILKKLKGR
ncbi:MAG: hypothetical protein ACLFNU_09050 [Bacteroidales bacterium]